MSDINQSFVSTICAKTPADSLVTVYFTGGSTAEFTMGIFDLLKTDTSVKTIIDSSTGEVLFSR